MAYCYYNGEVVDESKASISIHNLGLQRGFGIFDLFRGRNQEPTFIEDHLDRFHRSQAFLGLDRLIDKDEIREAVSQLQKVNGFQDSTFRLMLLADGSESEAVLKSLFYITNSDISNHQNPETGKVILHNYLREYPTIKSINYLTSNYLHRAKKKANAIDVIYHDNGIISEASRSNVFIVKDGVLLTPSENILEGITRKNILTFAENILPVSVQPVSLEALSQADEVFISSTLKEVMPIVEIDGSKVGEGVFGNYTKQIQQGFLDLLH